MTHPTILIADDDASILTVLERAFARRGYTPVCVEDGARLFDLLDAGRGDALVTDVRMPFDGEPSSSFDYLPRIRERRPDMPIIVISAQNTLMTAVRARELGAFDYLPKPFDLDHLIGSVAQSLKAQRAGGNVAEIVPEASVEETGGIIGASPAMQEIYQVLAKVVGNDLTVMISGESGTGKELVAQAIHRLGVRARRPFLAVNMAAIPRELVESELFGHEKGAFTGAAFRKAGTFERAEGGTLFLDEIGDMPPEAQTRLLRVLQQGEYTSVGGTRAMRANVRIICATHRDLLEQVRLGAFREDLYYRLNVVPIAMPPLRARAEDIPALVEHVLKKAVQRGLPQKYMSDEAMRRLKEYYWPGNVRELENMVYRLIALASSAEIDLPLVAAQLPSAVPSAAPSLEQAASEHIDNYFCGHGHDLPPPGLYARILPLVERPLILRALEATNGNQLKAATLLGINRNTLRKRMVELGIK